MKVAKVFDLDVDLILKCNSGSMNWVAPRPRDSSLNVSNATDLLKNKPRDFDESIKEFALEFDR